VGNVVGGLLTVTGKDVAGQPLTLTARLPDNGFLSALGLGKTIALTAKLSDMKVGDRRELTGLVISPGKDTTIRSALYIAERKPDIDGHQVFAVSTEAGRFRITSEILVDAAGIIVKESTRGSANATYTRRR
jgi:hypothetical protein